MTHSRTGCAPAAHPRVGPSSFRMLADATFAETPNQDSAVIEASGIKEIAFADIQKRHGVPRLGAEHSFCALAGSATRDMPCTSAGAASVASASQPHRQTSRR